VLAAQPLAFSGHAATRCAQRAIPPQALELLLDYGACARSRGADSYFLDQAGRRRLKRDLGEQGFRRVERWLDAYAVVADDGRIITAAWRTRRLRRH
jgi:hypothetical protein